MPFIYENLSYAISVLRSQHKASGLIPHKYLLNTQYGAFADYAYECLRETIENILDQREDIFMHNETRVVREAFAHLTQFDYKLIALAHGKALVNIYILLEPDEQAEIESYRALVNDFIESHDQQLKNELIVIFENLVTVKLPGLLTRLDGRVGNFLENFHSAGKELIKGNIATMSSIHDELWIYSLIN